MPTLALFVAADAGYVRPHLVPLLLSMIDSGIGAGVHCDGQVQVFHDMLGLFDAFTPKHAKRYAEAGSLIRDALSRYTAEVKSGAFPDAKHSFKMDAAALAELRPAGHERLHRRHALGLEV